MKKIVFFATTFLMFLAFAVSAQEQQPKQVRERATPADQATRMVGRLNKELTLTEKQQTDLKKWYTDFYTKREESMKKNKGDREAMMASMKKDQETTQAELKKVLTENQYKKFQVNEKKRQDERKANGGQRGNYQGQRGPGQGAPGQGGQRGGNRR